MTTTNETKTTMIDHLKEDKPIDGQLWVCLSFVSPEGIKNCTVRGLKIRGTFATKEEAKKHAEKLREFEPEFHVFIGEVGKWLPWDPDANDVDEQNYQQEELNNIVGKYKENLEKSKQVYDERKNNLKQAAEANARKMQIQEKLRKQIQQKLAEKNKDNKEAVAEVKETKEVPENKELAELEDKIKTAEDAEKKLQQSKEEIMKQVNSINSAIAIKEVSK